MQRDNKRIVLVDCDGTVFHWNWDADYMVPHYFANLQAYGPMIELINILRNEPNCEFRFCTKFINDETRRDKDVCLKKLWPDIRQEEIIYVPYSDSKFRYIKEVGDVSNTIVLIDDYSPNLFDAQAHGVVGIKALNGVNGRFGTWKGPRISVFDHPIKNMMLIHKVLNA